MRAAIFAALNDLQPLLRPGAFLRAVESGTIDEDSPLKDRPDMRQLVRAVLLSDVGGALLKQTCDELESLSAENAWELGSRTAEWARNRGPGLGQRS
jgi:hypothetical protein